MKKWQISQKLLDWLYVISLVLYLISVTILLFGPNGNWYSDSPYAIKGWRAVMLFLPPGVIFALKPLTRRNLAKKFGEVKDR